MQQRARVSTEIERVLNDLQRSGLIKQDEAGQMQPVASYEEQQQLLQLRVNEEQQQLLLQHQSSQEEPYLPDDERRPASQQLELNDFIDQRMDDNSAIEKISGTPTAAKIPTRRRK